MSKLEQLIKELCPNGVTFSKLENLIISLKTGLNPRQNFSLNVNGSVYPYITGKDIYDNKINVTERTDMITVEALEIINKRAQLQSGLLLFASTGTGTVGRMAIIDSYNNDWGISETLYAIKVDDKKIGSRYLLHYLYSQNAKSQFEPKISKGSVPHLKVKDLLNVIIPVPPIEVQAEIVKILDEYSTSVTALQQELEKELTARKKQYEYYSSRLFLDTNAPEIEMSELADFVYGYTDTAKDVGDTRFVRITDINEQGYLKQEDQKYITMTEDAKKSILRKGDIIMARTGATFGKVLYFDSDFPSVYASFLIKIIPNEKLLSRYYWHFAKTSLYWEQAKKLVTTGGQPQFNTPAVKKIRIPIPPIEEQKRIVSILDRFDKLCNDISEGLPAEIEARRKQYEYYRDKLLSFKET